MWVSAPASKANTTSMDSLDLIVTHTHTRCLLPSDGNVRGEEESRRREKMALERRARLACSSQRIKTQLVERGKLKY